MQPTLIILNPHAAGGRAGRVWQELEPILWERLGELVVVVTQRPEEVAGHLETAYSDYGIRRVIAIGGDGTNHSLINAVIALNEKTAAHDPMIYGNIPVGTGRDWARGRGIPTGDLHAMTAWIATAQPQPVDIGMLTLDENSDERREYFLNIASVGLSGSVTKRVNRVNNRRPWTFLTATIASILTYKPQPLHIELDGQTWYEGGTYLLAVANGTTFGRGMKIAPNAQASDGQFDVILVKQVPKLEILTALQHVYDGSHLTHHAVLHTRAKNVSVTAASKRASAASHETDPIQMELDGEFFAGRTLSFQVRPGLVQILS